MGPACALRTCGWLIGISTGQIFQKLAAAHIQEQTTPRPVQVLPPAVCA